MTKYIQRPVRGREKQQRLSGHGNVRMLCSSIMRLTITCDNQDGQAWDADSGDGTVYQYNYSYVNEGGVRDVLPGRECQ